MDEKHVSSVPASLVWSQMIYYRDEAMIRTGSIVLPDQRSRSQHIRVKQKWIGPPHSLSVWVGRRMMGIRTTAQDALRS